MQIGMFDGSKKFVNDKPIRLITLFSGYDSQKSALNYLGVDVEHYRTCEWAVKSIQALKDMHFEYDKYDYSKDYTKEELESILYNYGISIDYNEPMEIKQIKRKPLKWLKQVYNNIKATHNLVNIQNVKGSDLGIVNVDKYNYIMTYSFPCQDLSKAGKGKGMAKDSGTRSGMLWEVERILSELEEKPQVLIMENVPDVIGSNNMPHFAKWLEKLEELGYKNYWDTLNAKDYGIPQSRNRTFMVSILGDYYYNFPSPFKLKLKLKDMLEAKVDKKYYLVNKQIGQIEKWNSQQNPLKVAKSNTSMNSSMLLLKEKVNIVGNVNPSGNGMNGNVISSNGLCPTLTTNKGEGLKIIEEKDGVDLYDYSKSERFLNGKGRVMKDRKISPTLLTSDKFGVMEKVDLIKFGSYYTWPDNKGNINTQCNRVCNPKEYALTIPTIPGHTKVVEKTLKQELCEDLVESGILQDGDVINHSYTNSNKNKNSRITLDDYIESRNGIMPTLTTRPDVMGYYENYRIRKLTPKECFRLMGIKDSDFEKVSQNQSNASLYHLAGDSIVTTVLMAIFGELLGIEWQSKVDYALSCLRGNRMELGNLLFGHSYGEFEFPDRKIVDSNTWQNLLDKIKCDSYGYDGFENNTFLIRPYYWGDDELEIQKPNFVYKPLNFEIRWYKYPFRDSYINQNKTKKEILNIFKKCLESIKE